MNNYHRIVWEDVAHVASEPLPWGKFKDKVILITGASGQLAAYMVYTLLYLNDTRGLNAKVIGLARNVSRLRERFSDVLERQDLSFVIQDVCDSIDIPGRVDFVIHAATTVSKEMTHKPNVETLTTNFIGTQNSLNLARIKDAQACLYFSSATIYGDRLINAPTREDELCCVNPLNPLQCYILAKHSGEALCSAYFCQHRLPIKIARPCVVYGPGESFESGRPVPDFIKNVLEDSPIVLKSGGTAVRNYCYIADATSAFFTILLQGESGQAYNVADKRMLWMVREMADCFSNAFPESSLPVLLRGHVDKDVSSTPVLIMNLDVSKLAKLGWNARADITASIRRTVESCRAG